MQRQGGSVFTFRKCAGIFLSSIYILVNESVHKAWCRTHIYNILYVDDHVSPAKGDTTTCIRSFLANIEYVCCLLAAAPQISDLALCQFIYLLTNQYTKLGAVRIFTSETCYSVHLHTYVTYPYSMKLSRMHVDDGNCLFNLIKPHENNII